jgi:serine/threonine protein kinase
MYNRIDSMSLNKNDTNKPKLIGKGTYGCIFRPGLTCAGMKSEEDTITKIQHTNDISKNEKEIGEKIINELSDDYEKYFSPIIEDCQVNIETLNEEMNKCDVMVQGLEKKTPLQMSKMRYVGEHDLKIYYENMNGRKNKYEIIEKMMQGLRHALRGLKKLTDIDVVHYDIKEDNIICRDSGTPVFIDFGLSFETKWLDPELNEFQEYVMQIFAEYIPTYYPWCIEIHLICYIIRSNTESHYGESPEFNMHLPVNRAILKAFVDDYFDNANFASHSFIDAAKVASMKPAFLDYVNNLAGSSRVSNMTYEEFFSKMFVNDNLKTWDVYSLSVCYLKLCKGYFNNVESSLIKKLEECLTNIIYSIPPKRIDYIDDLYNNFDEYFQEITDEEKQRLLIQSPH